MRKKKDLTGNRLAQVMYDVERIKSRLIVTDREWSVPEERGSIVCITRQDCVALIEDEGCCVKASLFGHVAHLASPGVNRHQLDVFASVLLAADSTQSGRERPGFLGIETTLECRRGTNDISLSVSTRRQLDGSRWSRDQWGPTRGVAGQGVRESRPPTTTRVTCEIIINPMRNVSPPLPTDVVSCWSRFFLITLVETQFSRNVIKS